MRASTEQRARLAIECAKICGSRTPEDFDRREATLKAWSTSLDSWFAAAAEVDAEALRDFMRRNPSELSEKNARIVFDARS